MLASIVQPGRPELAVERIVEPEHAPVRSAGVAARRFPELAELAAWRRAGAESAAAAAEHQPQPQLPASGQWDLPAVAEQRQSAAAII